jgi:hypothetical protein
MTDITEAKRIALATIPPEAVEAAAAEIFKVRLAERPYPHSPRLIEWLIDVSREEATAALRAGIAAWPGMFYHPARPDEEACVFLPLPQEARDE